MAHPADKIQQGSMAVNVLHKNIHANENNHKYDLMELFYAHYTSVTI